MDSPEGGVVEAKDLVKSYGNGETAVGVLHGLNLRVTAGEFIALLGPSGSGKSTLLNILGLMDEPNSGDVLFSGRSTRLMAEEERAGLRNARLGFLFQFDSLLPEFTILENITMPARIAGARGGALAAAEGRALDLLGDFSLRQIKNRFPTQVSGGERQRAALCRSLINQPSVLLADEPTGNLDKQNAELVFKDLKSLSERHAVAVVMATHNESAGHYASRVLHMLDGAIEEEPRIIQ
jgi:ABC-type lipoprotein export system ATPase subunit